MPDARFAIWDEDSRYEIRDTGCGIWDMRCAIPDVIPKGSLQLSMRMRYDWYLVSGIWYLKY
jgi:hypothetical protein